MKYIAALLICLVSSALNASVTLRIGTSGWGNETTASTNGMAWGVIVSSDDVGFGGTFLSDISSALEGFTIPATASPSEPVRIGTTNYYFARAQSNTSSSGPPSFTNGFMNTVQFNLSGTVGTGDALGLLWFATGSTTAGSKFGFQDLAYDVPVDGASVTSGINSTPGLANNSIGLAAVPEPSRLILLGLGFAGLIWRRKR